MIWVGIVIGLVVGVVGTIAWALLTTNDTYTHLT